MRIIEPARYQKQPGVRRRSKHLGRKLVILLFVVLFAVSGSVFVSPPISPSIIPTVATVEAASSPGITLPWPGYGQAAIGAEGFDVLATAGNQVKSPTASVAKVVTALAILKTHPLKPGEQGPTITITEEDAASYHDFVALGGSVVPVNTGEEITEYQALQALLLPSANNIAFTLARWGFGSSADYINYANKMVNDMGLKQTHIADESGFSAQTVSTASDLVLLGEAALKDPVLAEIVAQEKAIVPVAGEIHNVNWLLGKDGINGIKTGNTDEAGGCYLVSAPLELANNQRTTVVVAIMAAPDLNTAIRDARSLINIAKTGFEVLTIVKKGQTLGSYKTSWGATSEAVSANDFNFLTWKGTPITTKVTLQPVTAPASQDAPVGQISVVSGGATGGAPLVLKTSLRQPSFFWNLQHRFGKAD